MRVTILGAGNMARAIAARALAGGHHVGVVGPARAPAEELADELAGLGTIAAADDARGDIAVLAVPYTDAPHAVRDHADELRDTVVVDITNPVDLSVLEPLDVSPFGSAAEVIADVLPSGAALVKAFNTTFPGPLFAGQVAGQPLDVFLAGDDPDAKRTVGRLVTDGGMRPIDCGRLSRARQLEGLGFLHMVMQASLGTHFASALKVLGP
jgi:predicted dinucleotide-binding enzyme